MLFDLVYVMSRLYNIYIKTFLRRSRLWVKACNRIIDRTPEELYKNYRVCSAHFNENMYLNDLKTRLLPQAIPILQTTSNSTNTNCDTNIISQGNNLIC